MSESRLKNKQDCACGCGLFGTPRQRPEGHIRGCKCKRCMGKRNRAKGDAKARKARKVLGIGGANTRHEELWGGAFRIEVKAGAQIKAIATKFADAESQSEQHRPIGDNRIFLMVAMPDGSSDGIVLGRLSQLGELLRHLSEEGSL
jgi:hypothetical protein